MKRIRQLALLGLFVAAATVPRVGHAASLTMSWAYQLISHVNACWVRPDGITDKTRIAARVIFELNPDGTLKGEPTLVESTIHPQGAAFGKSAIDAVKRCAPYTFLPAEEYNGGWDKIDMSFSGDPAAAAELKSGPKIDTSEIHRKLDQLQRERRN